MIPIKTDVSQNYRYILIGDKIYINLGLGLFELFFLLYFRTQPFSFLKWGTRIRLINLFPPFIIKGIRVIQLINEFYRKRKIYHLEIPIPSVSSKQFGHFLMKLRQGEYKIFNLKEQEVTTIFPKYISTSCIQERINIIKESTKCKIAPKLIDWNINEYYVKEDYINYNNPSYELNNMNQIYLRTFPILGNIMTTTEPKIENLQNYLLERLNYVESMLEKFKSISKMQNEIHLIADFCSIEKNRLKNFDNPETILLVFSHGDFWEGNILVKKNHSCVIDWNTLSYRSCYFDFYHMMFMLAAKFSNFDKMDQRGVIKLAKEFEPISNSFINWLVLNSSFEVTKTINHLDTYRHLFYLELVFLKLQVDEIENVGVEKQISEVATWIRRFEIFEESSITR